eukprot:scaffold320018_cov32-Tisochrysis_lutea.AAC.7
MIEAMPTARRTVNASVGRRAIMNGITSSSLHSEAMLAHPCNQVVECSLAEHNECPRCARAAQAYPTAHGRLAHHGGAQPLDEVSEQKAVGGSGWRRSLPSEAAGQAEEAGEGEGDARRNREDEEPGVLLGAQLLAVALEREAHPSPTRREREQDRAPDGQRGEGRDRERKRDAEDGTSRREIVGGSVSSNRLYVRQGREEIFKDSCSLDIIEMSERRAAKRPRYMNCDTTNEKKREGSRQSCIVVLV